MYQFKDPYIIDFTNVKYYLEMHKVIKESLDFPDYYGENWDAFWDCLTDMISEKLHIRIIGLEVIERKFPSESKIMIEILKRLKHYRDDKYSDEIIIEIVTGETIVELT